jgi:hypothetical protein
MSKASVLRHGLRGRSLSEGIVVYLAIVGAVVAAALVIAFFFGDELAHRLVPVLAAATLAAAWLIAYRTKRPKELIVKNLLAPQPLPETPPKADPMIEPKPQLAGHTDEVDDPYDVLSDTPWGKRRQGRCDHRPPQE